MTKDEEIKFLQKKIKRMKYFRKKECNENVLNARKMRTLLDVMLVSSPTDKESASKLYNDFIQQYSKLVRRNMF